MALEVGREIERYRVVRLLGEGGMAQVYLVRHTSLDTAHALKVLTLTGPTLKDRLKHEGKVQAQLRHENIVRVSDVLDVDGMPALVMDFIDGPDLHAWIRDVRPDAALAEAVFRGILEGVGAAHREGVVHRDLKPANVLMARGPDGDWVPRVSDFGLVKALTGDEQLWRTRTGMPMGTPQYMAPEQIRNAAGVDHRADLFSLGCILYELLTYKSPFDGPDLMAIFALVDSGQRDALPETVPVRLRQVVDACLQRDAVRRPADCRAIVALLDGSAGPDLTTSFASTGTSSARPTFAQPPATMAQRPGTRSGPPVAMLGVLAVASVLSVGLVGAGVAGAYVFGRSDPTDPCSTSGGRLGVLQSPAVFAKRKGSEFVARTDLPVLRDVPEAGAIGIQVCTLKAGSKVTMVDDPIRVDRVSYLVVYGASIQLPVDGEALPEPEPEEEEEEAPPMEAPPEPDDPAPSAPASVGNCSRMPSGAMVGWFYTKPVPFAPPPAQGRVWIVSVSKDVIADYPRSDNGNQSGALVCRIDAASQVKIERAPVRSGKGWWVPFVGGSIR